MFSKWRVIAVRINGRRLVVDEYLRRDAAEKLREELLAKQLFPDVFVEVDPGDHSRIDRQPAKSQRA